MKLKQLLLFVALLLASCLLSFSLLAQPTTVGLLCHFKLDGNTTNIGPANVTATAVSCSYTTNNANAATRALQFGGTTASYLDIVDNGNLDFTGTQNFTVSFSFLFNGSSTSGLIDNCLNYNGWGVWLWSTVAGVWNLQFNYKGNSVGSPTGSNFTFGVWHHVAIVRNGTTIQIYIDGALRMSGTEGTSAPSYPINAAAGVMTFSSFSPPRYNPFGGKIDEIRVYNRALSAAEILVLTPYSLPLKMGAFDAAYQDGKTKLSWETLTETNTSYFEIERSSDGEHFSPIGRVAAAGNSSGRIQYNYTDAAMLNGTTFYRLRMSDLDGAFTNSRIVVVKPGTRDLQTELFPNPVRDILQVQLPSAEAARSTLLVTDLTGRVFITRPVNLQKGQNAFSIPVYALAPGSYFLTVLNEQRKTSIPFTRQ